MVTNCRVIALLLTRGKGAQVLREIVGHLRGLNPLPSVLFTCETIPEAVCAHACDRCLNVVRTITLGSLISGLWETLFQYKIPLFGGCALEVVGRSQKRKQLSVDSSSQLSGLVSRGEKGQVLVWLTPTQIQKLKPNLHIKLKAERSAFQPKL